MKLTITAFITMLLIVAGTYGSAGSGATLQKRFSSQPKIYYNQEKGIPFFIEGKLSEPVKSGDYLSAALSFFEAYKSDYYMDDPGKELNVIRAETDRLGMHHIRFQQMYKGLRVLNRQLVVHFTVDGILKTVNGSYEPDIDLETVVSIDKTEAIILADKDLKSFFGKGEPDEPELIVFAWLGTNYLCWRMFLYSDNPSGRWEYFIDARTGEIIYKANRINFSECNSRIGTGKGVRGDDRDHIDTYYSEDYHQYYLLDCSRRAGLGGQMQSDAFIETRNYNGTTSGSIASDLNNRWDENDYIRACVDAHVYTCLYYDWLLEDFGRNGFDNSGSDMKLFVNRLETRYSNPYNNAYWDGSKVVIWPWSSGHVSLAACLDILAHEWSHAITEYTSNLAYESESGALNESFSDMMGTAFEHAHPEYDAISDWEIGELSSISGATGIRSMAQPHRYGQPDYYGNSDPNWVDVIGCVPECDFEDDDYNDCCGVHSNCGVGNKWFQLLSEGTTPGYPHHGVEVEGIGIGNAMDIAYMANTLYWTPNTGYYEAALVTVSIASELDYMLGYNYTGPVVDAWTAVGVFSQRYLFLIDRTGSMILPSLEDPSKNRLQMAKDIAIQDALRIIGLNQNAEIAVMTFTGSNSLPPSAVPPEDSEALYTFTDFTRDRDALRTIIGGIEISTGWTHLAEALAEVADRGCTYAGPGNRHLNIYTDGNENASNHDPLLEYSGACVEHLAGYPYPDPDADMNVTEDDWYLFCDPLNTAENPCTDYQLCLAQSLIDKGITRVNVRYFGNPEIKISGTDKNPDAEYQTQSKEDPPPDFAYLNYLSQTTGGFFTYESTTNRAPIAICHDVIAYVGANCSTYISIDSGSYDPDGDSVTIYQYPQGPYSIGQTAATMIVTDIHGLADTCQGLITVVDVKVPFCRPPHDTTVNLHEPTEICLPISCRDNCSSDPNIYIVDGPGQITENDEWCFTPPGHGHYSVTFRCEDSVGNYRDSTFILFVNMLNIKIEKTHNTLQGHFEYVSITTENSTLEMGGFDFLIAYDASALTFMEATPGQLLEDCGWEYFTYKYGVHGSCGDACPSGLLRIVAMAETSDGPNHPSCFGPPDYDPHELAEMKFLVTNDRTFECQYVPIKFFWDDCGDNAISSVDGEVLYVSDHVYEFDGTDITDPTFGFPTYFGVQAECLENPDPDKPDPVQCIDFVNGGIDIVCGDSIDARCDLNCNEQPFEIADAVTLVNYFIYGTYAFTACIEAAPTPLQGIEAAIAASDCNGDGVVLTVADLVYLIRVIVGDALPYPKPAPIDAVYSINDGILSVNLEIAAVYLIIKGRTNPINLTKNMDMKTDYDAENNLTKVLIYGMEKNQTFSGSFLKFEGTLLEIEAATYDCATVKFTNDLLPTEFVLHQNRPNPFNPITGISFSLPVASEVTLEIYNINGQKVATATQDHFEAGIHTVDWDGTNFASGVYLYKITAGDFTDTKKMLLLK